jgi:COP9 signalosome complex subunit 4
MLNTLYKDERLHSKNIDTSYNEFREKGLYFILEQMYYGGILKKDQVAEFQESLLSHQLANLADGSTVFDRAIMEHNLLSVSKLFSNITFQLLGYLLSVSPSQAEQIAASMIEEGRMSGTLDQVESLLHFSQENPMEEWNKSITQMYSQLDEIVSKVAKKHPEWIGSL